ncbi:peptidoglycan-associated lipoprotein Pal [Sphingosinicella humi]|uniref:Peptidoglycan-associated lipoprotein n=1 Tax=Allosphingosinicella humi TaxID=2068657 RepID=A0A2U2J2Z5_9SPHN|nr:peptidoglycan-associated lipoprotein Pal [Sphingosinicella humi]PWG02719.1 peptidoglycan-associated lipoprotein Pal [Sphingosinicella humi]
MNRNLLSTAAIAAALTLSACAKKAPEELPPPPSAPTAPTDTTGDTGQIGTGIVPGSRADFMQNVTSDRVFFGTDVHTLDAQARAVLDTQAQWLLANPSVNVTIEGHADERGTREYNLALGDRRANSAKNYLVSRGVPASRLNVVSWGKERPEALGSNESAWAQNRRAVTVVPQ